ncbi:MAG: hypothetical protein ACKOV8_05580, partial [Phycisphaerales bacterium]
MPRREGLAPAAVDTPLARVAAAAAAIVPGPTGDGPSPEVAGAIGHLGGAVALMEGDATPPDPWPTAVALGRMASGTAEDARPGDAAAPDAAAARARIAAIDIRTLRADARPLAADLVRSA